MRSVNFRLTAPDASAPTRAADKIGWLLYPYFGEEHIVIRSGETLTIDCGAELECAKDCALSLHSLSAVSSLSANLSRLSASDNATASYNQADPDDKGEAHISELVVHPSVCADGERVSVRVTNASKRVHVIVKNGFDITPRLGHGIFRSAVIVPYNAPIAYGLPTLSPMMETAIDHNNTEGWCSI